MDVLDAIARRRTVRRFLEVPVEWDKVGTILDAARMAPSAGGIQSWRFILIRSEAKRRAIAEASLQQHWMGQAPLLIVICSDLSDQRKFYSLRGERLYAIQECAAAAMNMLLAAESLGLATAWVGAFDENALSRILGTPSEVRAQIIIVVGYADEEPKMPKRLELEDVTYIDGWGIQNAAKVADIDMVLWNVRLAERGMKIGRTVVEAMGPLGERQKKKILPVLKRKLSERLRKKEGKKDKAKSKSAK